MARLRRRAGRGRERAGGHSAVAISRLSRRALPSRKSGPDQPVARNRGRAWRASNERRAVSAPCAHGSHRFDGRDEGREYRTGRPPAGRERSRPADVSAGFGLAGPLGDRSGPAPAAARPGRCLQPLTSAQRPEEQIELGVKQVEGGDFDAAVITLDAVARALAADGRRPRELTRAYTYLAIAYLGLSQEQTAKARFLEALKIQPELRLDPR